MADNSARGSAGVGAGHSDDSNGSIGRQPPSAPASTISGLNTESETEVT